MKQKTVVLTEVRPRVQGPVPKPTSSMLKAQPKSPAEVPAEVASRSSVFLSLLQLPNVLEGKSLWTPEGPLCLFKQWREYKLVTIICNPGVIASCSPEPQVAGQGLHSCCQLLGVWQRGASAVGDFPKSCNAQNSQTEFRLLRGNPPSPQKAKKRKNNPL